MVYDDRGRIQPTPEKKYAKMRDIRLSVLPSVIESLGRIRKVMEFAENAVDENDIASVKKDISDALGAAG